MLNCNSQNYDTCICCQTFDYCSKKDFIEKGRITAGYSITIFIIAVILLSAIVFKFL